MNRHDIIHVARYEMKLQSRDWLFRMLIVLALGGITFFQFFLQSNEVTPRWSMIALPCSVPFVNAYMFNIVQSFILVFVSTGVFPRERLAGGLESIHARPFENGDYLIGKFIGILSVFLFFNVACICLGCLLNVFYSFAPFNFWYYLFYLFTLTLPTLVFFLGFGFWLSGVFTFRFFSALVMFLVLCFSLGWAPGLCHGTFDFTGNSLTNVFSDVSGHVNLFFYLAQRIGYFLLGIGFFFLSVRCSRRMPNRVFSVRVQSICGFVLVLLGIGAGVLVEGRYARDERVRQVYRESFERNWRLETCRVLEHDITLEQKGEHIRVHSRMRIYNPDTIPLPELVLFLNPGLQVREVRSGDRVLSWTRDHQVLRVACPLPGLDSVMVSLTSEGEIDDRFCGLRLTGRQRQNTSRGDTFFSFGRRNSIVSDAYLLLTPGCGWYPVAIPVENPLLPAGLSRDFTRFRLKVVHPRQKVVLAPGVPSGRKEQDTVYFAPSRELPGMTVCGGNYKLKAVPCDHVVLFFYYLDGHESLARLFPRAKNKWVRESFQLGVNEIYFDYGLAKEGDLLLLQREWCEPDLCRLMVIETPLVFDAGWQNWTSSSERVQPGMILAPERGVGLSINPLSNRQRKNYPNGEEGAENAILSVMIRSFFLPYQTIPASSAFYRVFVKPRNEYGVETMDRSLENACYVYPLVADPEMCVYSREYPLLDIALKTLWRAKSEILFGSVFEKRKNHARGMGEISGVPWDGKRDKSPARFHLRGRRFDEVLRDRSLSEEVLEEVLYVKSEELLYRLMVNCTREEIFRFLDSFYGRYRGEIPLDVLADEARDSLGVDLRKIAAAWSDSRHDTRFKIKEASSVRYGYFMSCFHFKIYNDSDSPGVVVARLGLHGNRADSYHPFLIEGRQAKEVKIVRKMFIDTDCQIMGGNSLQVPSEFTIRTQTRQGDSGLQPSILIIDTDTSGFRPPENEYLVDDEDDGFRVIEPKITLLQNLWRERAVSGNRWTKSLNSRSHGELIRGYHAKKGSDGRSKAEWTVNLPEVGRYEVMALVYHNQSYPRYDLQRWSGTTTPPEWMKDSLKYYYVVAHGKEETPVVIETITRQEEMANEVYKMEQEREAGYITRPEVRQFFYIDWVSLGVYDFPAGKATVTLSDQGASEDMIIADAVKWVKIKKE